MDQSSVKLEKIEECDRRLANPEHAKSTSTGPSASHHSTSNTSPDSSKAQPPNDSNPHKANGHTGHTTFTKAYTKEQVKSLKSLAESKEYNNGRETEK